MKKQYLKFKAKRFLYKFIIEYMVIFINLRCVGTVQDLFNHDEIKKYESVVEDFKGYLESENVLHPIAIFDYFNYALWHGYLSDSQDFKYDTKRDLFIKTPGLGCISGDAVCLNDAGFLTDLFKSFGYNAFSVTCYVGEAEIENIRTNEFVERQIEVTNVERTEKVINYLDPIVKVVGNHSITAVLYDGEYYYFDPTNLVYLGKSGINNLEILNGVGHFDIRYLSSSIYSTPKVWLNLIDISDKEYNREYLSQFPEVNIDEEKLQSFFEEEEGLLAEINQGLAEKNQIVLFILSVLIASTIINTPYNTLYEYIKNKKELGIEIKNSLELFFADNDIYGFKNKCLYIMHLLENGYLTYNMGEEFYEPKATALEDYLSLITVDKNYDIEFLKSFFKSKYYKIKKIKVHNHTGEYKELLMFSLIDIYVFSPTDKIFFSINEFGELVSDNQKYQIEDLKIRNYLLQHSKNISGEDYLVSRDFSSSTKFYTENKETIEKVARKLAKILKK